MKDLELINELREPSVIYEKDPDDPNNPEVIVKGVGRYRLKTLEKEVRAKLQDLGQRGVKAYTHQDWSSVQYMVDHAAMNEMIDTIVRAKKEIGGIKEGFFGRKNDVIDLKKKLERMNKIVQRQEAELEVAYKKIEQLERQAKPRNPFRSSAGPFSKSDL